MEDMPDLAVLINAVQRNNIKHEHRSLVCKAVQDYYKALNSAGALRKSKTKVAKTKETTENK